MGRRKELGMLSSLIAEQLESTGWSGFLMAGCGGDEPIKLDIELKNPLQTSISVSGISLICDIRASSEATEFDISSSTAIVRDGKLGEPHRNLDDDASSLTLLELDLVLGGGETKRVQLSVTPKAEGTLKILGVRWKLSGFVGGYHYFEFDTKKKHTRGTKGLKNSSSDDLNFTVIKGLPKLEGCIKNLPGKAFAGDLRLLMLELTNQSEYPVKNMKMVISHPRFLLPGSLKDLNKEIPSSLETHTHSEGENTQSNVTEKYSSLLFSFPGDATISGGATFVWPLWFHAGVSGKISLYTSIYYEMESCSSDMIYRTLRMHYDVEVQPSLDVSLLITHCPSRLQEFTVRMDIVNRTISENFCLLQLSCVGNQWKISSLLTDTSIWPSQILFAGQALSCFFKLKNCTGTSDKGSKLTDQRSNVLLDSEGSTEKLIDICRSPLSDFHQHERHMQGKFVEGSRSTVDFILISKLQIDASKLELEPPSKLLSSHICHDSRSNKCPIWWLMGGPRTIVHDFATSFCEATFNLTIRNCSNTVISVRIATFDGLPSDTVLDSSENEGGWHDVPLVSELKVISDVQPRNRKSQSISPFVWCASSSTKLKLGPECTQEIPLRICAFSPGTYDLSNYELHWKLLPSEAGETDDLENFSNGMSRGHPFYVTTLQSPLALK